MGLECFLPPWSVSVQAMHTMAVGVHRSWSGRERSNSRVLLDMLDAPSKPDPGETIRRASQLGKKSDIKSLPIQLLIQRLTQVPPQNPLNLQLLIIPIDSLPQHVVNFRQEHRVVMRHRILPILGIPTRTFPIGYYRNRRVVANEDVLHSEITVCETHFVITLMDPHDFFVKNPLGLVRVPAATNERMECRSVVERAEALNGAYADLAACVAAG